jgi:hypothetical protein
MSVDLQPLAQSCLNGLVSPSSFITGLTWTPGYADTPQDLPGGDYYLDDATASAIASAVGGTVVQLPPFDVPSGTNIPLANWIQFPDGSVVLAANVANECNLSPSIPNMSSFCGMQQLLSYAIPDGVLNSNCVVNSQVAGTVMASAPESPSALTSGYGLQPLTPANPQATGALPAGLTPAQTATTDAPAAPASGAASPNLPTPALPIAPAGSPLPANANTSPTSVSGCFNPISAWLSMDTCLGPLGIVEWALVALAAVMLLSGGKR